MWSMRQSYTKQRGLNITALMWSMRKLYTKQRILSVITLDVVDEAVAYQAARPQHHRIGCGR